MKKLIKNRILDNQGVNTKSPRHTTIYRKHDFSFLVASLNFELNLQELHITMVLNTKERSIDENLTFNLDLICSPKCNHTRYIGATDLNVDAELCEESILVCVHT